MRKCSIFTLEFLFILVLIVLFVLDLLLQLQFLVLQVFFFFVIAVFWELLIFLEIIGQRSVFGLLVIPLVLFDFVKLVIVFIFVLVFSVFVLKTIVCDIKERPLYSSFSNWWSDLFFFKLWFLKAKFFYCWAMNFWGPLFWVFSFWIPLNKVGFCIFSTFWVLFSPWLATMCPLQNWFFYWSF